LSLLSWGVVKDKRTSVGVATSLKLIVPAHKRWWLFGGVAERTQNATVIVTITDDADKVIFYLTDTVAAGVTDIHYPFQNNANNRTPINMPIPLKEGWKIAFTYGANQDANAFCSAIILEVGTSGSG